MTIFSRHFGDVLLSRLADGEVRLEDLTLGRRRHLAECVRCASFLEGHRRARRLLLKSDPRAVLPTAGHAGISWIAFAQPVTALLWGGLFVIAVARLGGPLLTAPGRPGVSPSGGESVPVTTTPLGSPRSTATTTLLSTGSMPYASWSPDGNWLLVRAGGQLRLFDDRGHEVRSLAGDRAVWLDARTFLATGPNGSTVGSVGTEATTRVALVPPQWMLSNGHGALALATGSHDAAEDYVVWTPAGATNPHPGEPVAWSRDGTQLAVWHNLHAGQGASLPVGWIEIVGWPGLAPVLSLKTIEALPQPMAFDPSGRYLALLATHAERRFGILDVRTGTVQPVGPVDPMDRVAWFGQELVIPGGNTSATASATSGGSRTLAGTAGDTAVVGAADGSLVAIYDPQVATEMHVLRVGGDVTRIDLPGVIEPGAFVSPTGNVLVFVGQGESGYGLYQLSL